MANEFKKKSTPNTTPNRKLWIVILIIIAAIARFASRCQSTDYRRINGAIDTFEEVYNTNSLVGISDMYPYLNRGESTCSRVSVALKRH